MFIYDKTINIYIMVATSVVRGFMHDTIYHERKNCAVFKDYSSSVIQIRLSKLILSSFVATPSFTIVFITQEAGRVMSCSGI